MYQIYNGDCIKELEKIPDNSIDMLLTDPPYCSGGRTMGEKKQSTTSKYTADEYQGAASLPAFEGDTLDQRSFCALQREILIASSPKIKEGGLVALFIDWRNLPAMTDALQMAGMIWDGIVVWDKGNSRSNPERFRNDCEYIVWGHKGYRPLKYVKGCKVAAGCYRYPIVQSKKKQHQTEKPVALLEDLLYLVPDGGAVLDPFMGSASCGEACLNKGLDFYGIELSEEYFQIAKNRLERISKGEESA